MRFPSWIRANAARASQLAALAALILIGHGYFVGANGWNQYARLGPVFTFVEPGPDRFTLRLGDFVRETERAVTTGDWAEGTDGHYYSNKAPGASLIGIPAYATLYLVESLCGLDVRGRALTRLNGIVINFFGSILWTIAAACVLLLFGVARGLSESDAFFIAALYAFGTLVFPYDTSLWGHSTASGALLIAACLLFWPSGPRRLALAGFFAGFAVLVEYTAALPLAGLGAALLARRRPVGETLRFAIAAAFPVIALLVYQKLAFGSFWATATSRSNPIMLVPGLRLGILGGVSPAALWGLTFSPYRGLFLYCPVLLFSFVGAVLRWREGRKALVACAVGVSVVVLVFVSTHQVWWGAWCSGPRYIMVSLPFWCLLLPGRAELPRVARLVYAFLSALSVFNMLVIAATETMVSPYETNPLYGLAYRAFFSGQYPLAMANHNLGAYLLRLPPRWDVLPWIALCGLGALVVARRAPRSGIA